MFGYGGLIIISFNFLMHRLHSRHEAGLPDGRIGFLLFL